MSSKAFPNPPKGAKEGELNQIILGDCLEVMRGMADNSVDLTVTSPPYDDLRKYGGYSFDFENIAKELFRLTKDGGVVVWVISDQTKDGSESGTSFKQALYFKQCGFWLYDTMIWQKSGVLPTEGRYYNNFEYMFVLSKGKPKTLNFITDHKTVNGGKVQARDVVIGKQGAGKGNNKKLAKTFVRKHLSRRMNTWHIHQGQNGTSHPAVFPLKLAKDHIISWSNEGDTILDPFLGSGTTAVACKNLNRNYIGIEISPDYVKIAQDRLKQEVLL